MSGSVIFGIIAIGLLVLILWRVWTMVRSPLPPEMTAQLEEKEARIMNMLEQKIAGRVSETVRMALDQFQGQVRTTEQSVSQKLQQANETFAKVSGELGRLHEATRKMEEVGRNMTSLQDLLRAPKMRGGMGEFFLARLLQEILPADFFVLQYGFQDGERVDAAIRLSDRLVCVDSKFPLENFQKMGQAGTDQERGDCRKAFVRDVKIHIDSIARKYIRPEQGTYDFALMFIPAENVYYETIVKEEGVSDEKGLLQHALANRVIPVSPNSFYAYLKVILLGLKGLSIEQDARRILEELMALQRELSAVRDDFNKAGKQLGNAKENFDKADKHLARFESRLGMVDAGHKPAGQLPAPEQGALEQIEG